MSKTDFSSNLVYEAPKGQRIHRYGMGITVLGCLWYNGKWGEDVEAPCSTHAPCKTLKAFKRHLKKHAKELQGYTVIWTNRYQNHNISITM